MLIEILPRFWKAFSGIWHPLTFSAVFAVDLALRVLDTLYWAVPGYCIFAGSYIDVQFAIAFSNRPIFILNSADIEYPEFLWPKSRTQFIACPKNEVLKVFRSLEFVAGHDLPYILVRAT